MNNHIMLDIETMGVRPGAALVSLAAIQFNIETGEIGKSFYEIVDLQSCLDVGLKIEIKTMLWWFKQSKEAQDQLYKNGAHLSTALEEFRGFIKNCEDDPKIYSRVQLWGNSARFDLGILEHCYSVMQLSVPWNTWIERDVRTMDFLRPEVKGTIGFEGIAHYPIDDCKHQIKYVCEIYRRLKDKL